MEKTFYTGSGKVNNGDIFYADLGMNYNPELAYAHPVVVLEEVGALVRTISEGRLLDKKEDCMTFQIPAPYLLR